MDLNSLLPRHPRPLLIGDRCLTPREQRAHDQFAREYADQMHRTLAALGSGRDLPGAAT